MYEHVWGNTQNLFLMLYGEVCERWNIPSSSVSTERILMRTLTLVVLGSIQCWSERILELITNVGRVQNVCKENRRLSESNTKCCLIDFGGNELFWSSWVWFQTTREKEIAYLFCTLINICGIKDTVNYIGDYKFPLSLSLDNLILFQRISLKDCMYFWSN